MHLSSDEVVRLRLLSRRCLTAALFALVAACGTSDDKAGGPTTKAGQAKPYLAEAAIADVGRTQRPNRQEGGTTEAPRDAGNGGLTKPEFYRGTGALARDSDVERAEAGLSQNGRVTLNFANAEIRDVIDIVLGDTLNLNYVIDPQVQGSITVRTSQALTRDSVIPALENILALNGVAMTLMNGTYMVVPRELAAKGLSGPAVSPSDTQLARGFGINILPLDYASAGSMLEILTPFVNPGTLRADDARNLLIFTGNGNEARGLMEMVDVFDVDWMKGMSFALFPVDVADIKSLVTDLTAVFLQDGQSPLAGLVRFVPIERLNAVLVISPQPAYLDRAQTWIERLDRGVEGAGRRIFVYSVENGRAADMAAILTQVFDVRLSEGNTPRASVAPGLTPVELGYETGGQLLAPAGETTTGEGGQAQPSVRERLEGDRRGGVSENLGAFVQESGDIRIIADEANNALLVLSTASEYRMIEATLKKLDAVPLQVLIEATIAEVQLNDNLRYGVQWFLQEGDLTASLSNLSSGAISTIVPGFNFVADTNEVRVVLSALTDVTDVKVISSPSLMVLDNQTARLQVGDEVPIATQSSVSVTDSNAPVVNSIQLRDTGVILEVTPRVNPGGLVLLEITQEVSSVVATTTSDIDSPTIRQRKIESTIAVQSGDTVALGGLIRDDVNEQVTGIPLLSDIPILGNLFKTTDEKASRTELLVLITPRVVRSQAEAQKVTNELRRRMRAVKPLEQKITAPQSNPN